MLSIIIAVAIGVGFFGFAERYTKLRSYDSILVMLVIMAIGVIVATSPIYGYEQTTVEEKELVYLYGDSQIEDEKDILISVSSNDVYMYKYKLENENNETEISYEIDIINDDVIVTESKECEEPVLRKYVEKPKTGLFSFCWEEKVEYEFYVPEGTVKITNEAIN